MKKSTFLAASWFLVLLAFAVGVLTLPVKIWPRDKGHLPRPGENVPVVHSEETSSISGSTSSPVIPSRLPDAGVSP